MRRAALIATVLVTAAPGCGDGEPEQRDPFEAISNKAPPAMSSASPRWEHLATLSGPGSRTRAIEVDDRAIQWRARWRCRRGRLAIEVDPPPSEGNPLARAGCPRRGRTESIQTGSIDVTAAGAGDWLVKIEQQVDTPLNDPPLAGMSPGNLLARGDFYDIDKPAEGTASLYRLPGGRLALRFEDFQTSANVDLFVWLSEAREPRTTKQAFRAPYRVAAELKSTQGDQNYVLPAGTDARDVRSIVIWCEPVRNAYVAAALRPVRAGDPS